MSDELQSRMYDHAETANRTHVPELEKWAYNQMPKNSVWEPKLFRYDGTDLYHWYAKLKPHGFSDPIGEPFVIPRLPSPTGGLPTEVYKAADNARTAYLRDVDCNDQIEALCVAVDAAFSAASWPIPHPEVEREKLVHVIHRGRFPEGREPTVPDLGDLEYAGRIADAILRCNVTGRNV